jgi:hypothetical protein
MNEHKPKPGKAKFELREPAKPLAEPEIRQLPPNHPMAAILEPALKAQATSPPPTTSPYHLPLPPPTKLSAAPTRDFARVANSINRDALPAGLFRGTSKKTYDALYQRTRGAILPTRQLKARHGELREWAKVSHNTLREHLRHLEAVGLLVRKWELGDNDGVIYEVFIPEEISTSYHLLPPPTTSDQNLVGPSNQNLVVGGGGQVADSKEQSEEPKTFIKTIDQSDDEPAARIFEKLRSIESEITGKSSIDPTKWLEVVEVLAAELRIAAARTTVSSAPAFLAEHLRRRLWKIDKRQAEREGRELPDQPIKQSVSVNASDCPDCRGSGWWYPEGQEKGVAKCSHVRLATG